jgi:hypothetical protein
MGEQLRGKQQPSPFCVLYTLPGAWYHSVGKTGTRL